MADRAVLHDAGDFALVLGVGYGGWVALSPAILRHFYGTQRLGSVRRALHSGGVGVLMDRGGRYIIGTAAMMGDRILARQTFGVICRAAAARPGVQPAHASAR